MAWSFSVPMTRATGLGPLPELLEEREGARVLQSAFRAERLPLAVIEQRDAYVPVAAMMRLFERAAGMVGERTFGFEVGAAMDPTAYGPWLEYSAAATTLGEALLRTVETARFQQTGGRLAVAPEGEHVIWRYLPPDVRERHVQHSDHVIGPMLGFCASYLGPRWRPVRIELDYPRDPLAEEIEARLPAPVRFGRPGIGLVLEARDLARSRHGRRSTDTTYLDVEASDGFGPYEEPTRSILAIVALRLMEGRSDIEGAAEMAGVGVQTLQRRLRRAGGTYRDLTHLARRARAKALLADTSHSLTDIAFSLGYADHANFTRAFSRWEGCSPSEFRRECSRIGRAPAA